MKKIYFTYLCLLIVFISACDKEITLDLPYAQIKPVVYGLAQSGKAVRVSVQKSIATTTFPDTLDLNIQTNISLYVNSYFQEKLKYSKGIYTSDYLPQIGDTLRINFLWEGKDIESQTTIPETPQIDSVIYVEKSYFDVDFGDYYNGLGLFFSDPAKSKNFYELGVLFFFKKNNKDTVLLPYGYYSNTPILVQEDILDYEPRTLVFSDLLFNGQKADINIAFDYLYPNQDEEWYDTRLYLLNVSKDYYIYQKSLIKNKWAQQPDIFNGGMEFINVPSNIKNAYGIFKGFSITSVSIHNFYQKKKK